MARQRRWILDALVGAGILTTLAVGASAAWAKTTVSSCTFNPPSQLGTCATQEDCQTACKDVNGNPENMGTCTNGCCFCVLAS